MTVQVITSPSGEEMVVLPRRDYDLLLARAGDLDAEDRVLGAAAEEVFRRVDAGAEGLVDVAERYPHLVPKNLK